MRFLPNHNVGHLVFYSVSITITRILCSFLALYVNPRALILLEYRSMFCLSLIELSRLELYCDNFEIANEISDLIFCARYIRILLTFSMVRVTSSSSLHVFPDNPSCSSLSKEANADLHSYMLYLFNNNSM